MLTKPQRDRLANVVVLSVTLLLLGVLFWRYDRRLIVSALAQADPRPLLCAGLILVFSNMLGVADRWRRVVGLTGLRLSFAEAWLMRMGGAAIKLFTPFKAGELLRLPYLSRQHGLALNHALSAVAYDKVIIVLGLSPALLLRAIMYDEVASMLALLGVAAMVTLLSINSGRGLLLKLVAPFGQRITQWSEGVMIAFANAGIARTLALVAYSALILGAEAVVLALCLRAVGVDIDISQWWTVLPGVMLVAMVPVTFAGVGAREATLITLFPAADPARLIAAGLLFFLLVQVMTVIVGLPWTPTYLRRVLAKKQTDD